jgi:hypothetical protein
MSNWNKIKNNIAELNNITKLSPKDNKPLDNELIMCLFCNKINLKYRYKPYYDTIHVFCKICLSITSK